MNKNIKLVGVGGQGTILAAKVLVTALLNAGYDVKMSEIHGMSQRGGSVSSEIRYGEKVYSPVIEKGDASGGSGANFIVELCAMSKNVKPIIQAIMIGDNGSNQGFAFSTDGYSIKELKVSK